MTSLLDPFDVGPRTAANRVVFGPHETNLGRGRAISDRHVAYYRRRAAGGCGIVVTEEASVHASDWPMERAPLAEESGPGWSAVAEACQEEGALVLAAIGHSGGQGTSHWSQRELWAPSPVPEVNTREVPKVMEAADIAAVVEGFGRAAELAVASGCDGVEVNAGQHSLVRQFLSGLTNTRDDDWGRDRTRFALEVLDAVRSAVGPDAVVALRLSCDELAPWAGITPEQAPELAGALVGGGSRVDLLTVVRGSIYSLGATRPDGHTPPGCNLELSGAVRAVVRSATDGRVPVVAQGSIVDVDQAQWALDEGLADAVEMTRAQLADAQLVRKLRAGVADRIRPCLLCNQHCAVRDNRNPIISCTVDPATGHELDAPDLVAAADDRVEAGELPGGAVGGGQVAGGDAAEPPDLVVVGGGPAGLETARAAAVAGCSVRLVERGPVVGGLLDVVAQLPGRSRFADLAEWYRRECERLGVEVRTGVEVSADDVDGWRAAGSRVVEAVGGTDGAVGAPVVAGVRCWTPSEVLVRGADVLPPGDVLVWDPVGGPVGVGVAELLAAAGRTVHLATQDFIVGNELARSGDLAPANSRLATAGVVFHRRSVLREVTPVGATIEDRFSARRSSLEVAAVVDAGHRLPGALGGVGTAGSNGTESPVHRGDRVGDAVAPRTVLEAVLEGRRAVLVR